MGTTRSRSDTTLTTPSVETIMTGGSYPVNGSADIDGFTETSLTQSSADGYTVKTMTDVVTPNYKSLIAKGVVINNPCDRTVTVDIPAKATAYKRYRVDYTGGKYYGAWWDGPVSPCSDTFLGADFLVASDKPGWVDEVVAATSAAVTEAHANVSSNQISALASLAEGRKTVDSMVALTRKVLTIARKAKKLDYRYFRKELSFKELSNSYMELRYALRPMIIDAAQVCNALDESRLWKTVRSTARGYRTLTSELSDTADLGASDYTWTRDRKVRTVTTIRAGVLSDTKLSVTNVWGLDQPIEAMWEIVPFSFILDWFFTIGDTIAAWTPNVGVRELASWVSVHHVSTSENSAGNFANTGNHNVHDQFSWSGRKSQLRTIYKRTVNPSLSIYPASKIRLDSLKLLDLTIIGKGLLRR